MTDILKTFPAANNFQNPIRYEIIDLDFGDSANSDMLAAGTHNIFDIAAGEAVVQGWGAVYTSLTSTSTDTIQFKVGAGTLTAQLGADDLDAGFVFQFNANDLEDTVGQAALYAKSAADTLDLVVNDHALTAGRIILVVGVLDVNAAIGGNFTYE